MAGSTGAPANARAAQLLLRATRHTVDALAREGRLPSEQAALLRALLLRESHPVEPSMGGDRPDVQRDPAGEGVVVGGGGGGWAALPEGVEDGVFSALRKNSFYVHGNGDHTRLVCKQWKRWVTNPLNPPAPPFPPLYSSLICWHWLAIKSRSMSTLEVVPCAL